MRLADRMTGRLLIGLSRVSASIGSEVIFSDVTLNIQQGDRIALVGRNGAGKSTLASIIAGRRDIDGGERRTAGGVSIGYLSQSPDLSGFRTLGDYVTAAAPEQPVQLAQKAAAGLGFDPGATVANASGGEWRRAAIAALLSGDPDLLILDEPTNHLDLQAVIWLEERLISADSAVVLISHDRALLKALTRRTVWIDRGRARQIDRGFAGFEDWRDTLLDQETAQKQKLDKTIRSEARWAAEGISARRKRNQRRLAQLQLLRAGRRNMRSNQEFGRVRIAQDPSRSRILIDAENICKCFNGHCLVDGLSLRIRRGDRIALTGPNGCGKTTLIRMLCGQLQPDSGHVRLSENAVVAAFDQIRDASAQDLSVREYMAGGGAHARDRIDRIAVGGSFRHIAGYLEDFLFSASQIESPLRTLSGGERARLEFARLMARKSNVLILDEPTNDLDIETLDLLQELLGGYKGAVLLVSHDRDFLDRVATGIVACQGGGRWTESAGGWTDNAERLAAAGAAAKQRSKPKRTGGRRAKDNPAETQLSFTESFRLAEIENLIPLKEAAIALLSKKIAEISADSRDHETLEEACRELAALQGNLDELEREWIRLSEKSERSG